MNLIARFASPVLLALAMASGTIIPQNSAQAAGLPDLDVKSCYIVDDPIDYGDGIDWYKMQVVMTNKGTADAGSFKYLARPIWGTDLFSDKLSNEGYVVKNLSGGLKAGQSLSTFFWVTKKVVDQRTWGIFLDNNGFNQGTISESKETNNHCTAFVNPS